MPLQHYIPATFLANFSKAIAQPRRESLIAVGDKHMGKCFTTRISKIAAIQDLYTLFSDLRPPNLVDNTFGKYEGDLELAINQLISRDLSANMWANILVPFVTGFLVRGPDFNSRYQGRVPNNERRRIFDLVNNPLSDHINMGRVFENARLLATIATATWRLLEITGDRILITNDLGYAGMWGPLAKETGIAVPLGQGFILAIIPKNRRIVAIERHDIWMPNIDRHVLPPQNHIELNKIIALNAQRFIFGQDEDLIRKYLFREHKIPRVPEAFEYGFRAGNVLMNNSRWQELISKLSKPPKSRGATIRMDLLADSSVPPWGFPI